MTIPNRLTIEALDTLTPADLRDLPVAVLADLQNQLSEEAALIESRKSALWNCINERFAALSHLARTRDARDTGTVHLELDGYDIACATSKRVVWDDDKLLAAISSLSVEEQKKYLKYKFSVPEEKYQHAPADIKAILTPARTMKPTKETFVITQKDD